MGVASIREIAKCVEMNSEELAGETVAVDAHNWLYKYMIPTVQYTETSEYTTNDGVELPAVLGLLQGLKRFYENDITPVFVYDGVAHDLKAEELAQRKEQKQKAESKFHEKQEQGDIIAAARFEARSQHLDGAMVRATQKILDTLSIPVIEAHSAGEAQAAYMAANSEIITSVVSDDYDALLFGSPVVIRDFTSSEPHERIDLQTVLSENNLTRNELVWYAILCGTDYNDGAYGYGPKKGLRAVQEKPEDELERVILSNDSSLTSEDQLNTVLDLFMNPTVIEEFPEPRGLQPASQSSVAAVVENDIGLETETICNAVASLGEVLPNDSSLSQWG